MTIPDREPAEIPPGGAIAIGHLIALNDEIAALARAGMPLEKGLMGVGGDLPGRLGRIATALGQRMSRGQSLPQAIDAEGTNLPSTYRAVVEAGLRSGRLAEALEGLAEFARNYAELRGAIGLAILYPLIVMMLGYGLFVAILVELIPRLREAFLMLRVKTWSPLGGLETLGSTAWLWGPILPTLVLLGIVAWVYSGRASGLRPGRFVGGLGLIPGIRGILADAMAAQFAEWLALLVEHGVPWPEALTLAGAATGDRRLSASAQRLAESSRRGEPASVAIRGETAIPPLLRWILSSGSRLGSIVPPLRHAARTYRRRSFRKATALRVVLPSILVVVLGGMTTCVYVMTLFVPWTRLLNNLTR